MLSFRSAPLIRLVMLPLTLVAFLSGCHKWVELEPPFHGAAEGDQGEHVQVTRSGGSVLKLKKTVVYEDSVVRWVDDPTEQFTEQHIPMNQLKALEDNIAGTIGLVLGVTAVVLSDTAGSSGGYVITPSPSTDTLFTSTTGSIGAGVSALYCAQVEGGSFSCE